MISDIEQRRVWFATPRELTDDFMRAWAAMNPRPYIHTMGSEQSISELILKLKGMAKALNIPIETRYLDEKNKDFLHIQQRKDD